VPCPVAILTLGLLLWAAPTAPRWLLVVPAAWAAVATTAAARFGMVEDYGLIAAAAVALALSRRRVPPAGTARVALAR
jgi:hypothetical protein